VEPHLLGSLPDAPTLGGPAVDRQDHSAQSHEDDLTGDGRSTGALIEEATVDTYDEIEAVNGFLAVIDEHLAVPFSTTVLGVEVNVVGVNLTNDHASSLVAVSRVKVEPVTGQTAREAARLLKAAGLHGHQHAIDATVAEAALRQPGPVVLLTSDIDDMARLCGKQIGLIGLWVVEPQVSP
jgi:hypothetical protein